MDFLRTRAACKVIAIHGTIGRSDRGGCRRTRAHTRSGMFERVKRHLGEQHALHGIYENCGIVCSLFAPSPLLMGGGGTDYVVLGGGLELVLGVGR